MKLKKIMLTAMGVIACSGILIAAQTTIGWDTPYFQFAGINETSHGAPNIENVSGDSNAPFGVSGVANLEYYQGLPALQDRTVQSEKYGAQIMYSFCTSGTPAGFTAGNNETVNPDMRNFQGFNFAQTFVYFGGAAGEGEILVPSPGMILQAHKNGVPIFGCIFFNQGDGTESSWITGNKSNQLGNSDYVNKTLAPKLELLAKEYHFDGYFINNEANTTEAADNNFQQLVNDLLKSGLYVNWYYVYNTSNLTSTVGSKYYICADMGVNYIAYDNVNTYERNNTDLEQNIARYPISWANAKDTSDSYPNNHVAVSLFAADFSAMDMSVDNNVSAGCASGADSIGLVKQLYGNSDSYVPNSGNRFITTFNTGSGYGYFVDGSSGSSGIDSQWNDESDADYSLAYPIVSGGDVCFNFTQAWLGGSSLDVKTNNAATLFNTNFIPDSNAYVVVYYKGTLPNNASILLNGTSYAISSTQLLQNGWHAFYTPINSSQANTTISSISISNCSGVTLGKIYVGDSESDTTTFSIKQDGTTQYWSPDSGPYQYLCYDSSGKLLAGTALPAYSSSALIYSYVNKQRSS